ncbi:MAG: His-Xaa-Ser system-associated MauG-like protein [Sulfurovum sp.]|nr:His-Xaa-Ser system-associated MauG-like protein [Sulfurovum sp.]MCB4764139.1 His-Xaa-Ser system-associated MauG-like protein [Sulfurovum sp.]MCB4766514.1 His-Xaa-Ser system-associated MauG-like protein [Sulfurovum sp.]MCB4773281.1 His-Xaa-Ser system-associated MauG-like protein [Sulfurovum sp.]MCB4773999.1 His-Xaa-Ser system-associated MauG-like protein [Sulfurovum sp.]
MRLCKSLWLFFILTIMGFSLSLDEKLDLIISVHKLTPKVCAQENTKKTVYVDIGRELFESTIISGNKDMSCSVCHLDKFGSADGLPMAVGVMGEGNGTQRYLHGAGALVQRNALSLIGRSNTNFNSYFWDGKVEQDGNFTISQLGEYISNKFNSPLAVASIMPILERDELMGAEGLFSLNKIAREVGDKLYNNKYDAISKIIQKRLYKSTEDAAVKLKNKLEAINITEEVFELADIGNLLADFIADKFKCSESRFDQYIKGNKQILTQEEKAGAVLFFGKGKCSSCHSGNLFSDFKYHSIGSPQGYFGPHTRHRDIGRAGVTNKAKDMYRFRTPPLIEVIKTAPYGHSGAFENLYDVILHHINPVKFYATNTTYMEADYFRVGTILSSRDQILDVIDINNELDIMQIIAFLQTL